MGGLGIAEGIGNIIAGRRASKAAKKAYNELEQAYAGLGDAPQYVAPQYATDVATQRAEIERAGFADPGSAEAAKHAAYQSAYNRLDRALNAVPGLRGGVATGTGSRAVQDVFVPLASDIENMARQHAVQRAQMQQQARQFDASAANAAAQQFANARNQALLALTQQRNTLANTDAGRQLAAQQFGYSSQMQQAENLANARLGQGAAHAQAAQMFGAGLGGVMQTAGQAALMGLGGMGLAAGPGATGAQRAASIMMGWGNPASGG